MALRIGRYWWRWWHSERDKSHTRWKGDTESQRIPCRSRSWIALSFIPEIVQASRELSSICCGGMIITGWILWYCMRKYYFNPYWTANFGWGGIILIILPTVGYVRRQVCSCAKQGEFWMEPCYSSTIESVLSWHNYCRRVHQGISKGDDLWCCYIMPYPKERCIEGNHWCLGNLNVCKLIEILKICNTYTCS